MKSLEGISFFLFGNFLRLFFEMWISICRSRLGLMWYVFYTAGFLKYGKK